MKTSMDNTVKRFYDLAYDYHVSATTLWLQLVNMPYIFNPTVYLLRHTTELLLKGLIVKETVAYDQTINVAQITITENNSSKKLTSIHSLLSLWQYYKTLNHACRLVPRYSPTQEKEIDKVIKYFDGKDFDSTNFRYPYTKHGATIVIEPFDVDSSGITPDLSTKPPCIIQQGDRIYIIKRGLRHFEQTQNLFDIVELLFQFLEQ